MNDTQTWVMTSAHDDKNGAGRGSIHLILGPMFSGKSTEMLRRTRRFAAARQVCLVVKYRGDTRYSDTDLSTHDRQVCPAHACMRLAELTDDVTRSANVIGIDEGQFFPDVVEFSIRMADVLGKTVIIAALDGTFQRQPFWNILELVPYAETVTKLNAVCMRCAAEAPFTVRLGPETQLEVIGGADKYEALCRACLQQNVDRNI